jgi:hypothetical protein
MNQSISEIVKALPETENVTRLQDRLNAVGIKEDLAALPAAWLQSEKIERMPLCRHRPLFKDYFYHFRCTNF